MYSAKARRRHAAAGAALLLLIHYYSNSATPLFATSARILRRPGYFLHSSMGHFDAEILAIAAISRDIRMIDDSFIAHTQTLCGCYAAVSAIHYYAAAHGQRLSARMAAGFEKATFSAFFFLSAHISVRAFAHMRCFSLPPRYFSPRAATSFAPLMRLANTADIMPKDARYMAVRRWPTAQQWQVLGLTLS